MASRHEQILAAVATKLGTLTPSVPVYRSLLRALTREESPAIVVEGEKWDVVKINNDLAERELVFRVRVIARGQTPDSVADEIVAAAHQKILEDTNLGGLTLFLREIGGGWAMEEADLDAVVVTMRFMAQYRTAEKSLT